MLIRRAKNFREDRAAIGFAFRKLNTAADGETLSVYPLLTIWRLFPRQNVEVDSIFRIKKFLDAHVDSHGISFSFVIILVMIPCY